MKKWTFTLLAAIALQTQAADFTYRYLVVTDAQGNSTSLAAEGLRLTVSNGKLVATNADGTATFTLAQLSSMVFSESDPSTVTAIDVMPGSTTPIEAYTVGGMHLGTFASMSQLRSAVGQGVYIIKQNGTTKKITVK